MTGPLRRFLVPLAIFAAASTLATTAPVSAAGRSDVPANTPPPPPPTTPAPPPDIPGIDFDEKAATPACVVIVHEGDWLSVIAEAFDDPTISVGGIVEENSIPNPDQVEKGQRLDVCVGNGINDITGHPWPADDEVPGGSEAVKRQQRRINTMLEPYGFPTLLVDGVSGPLTEQALCATRLLTGLPRSRADMINNSPEGKRFFAAPGLTVPAEAATDQARWILVDRQCQVMFVGEWGQMVYVFPTSTGERGHETRLQNATPAYRFDPAADNNGWHDSTHYPVPEDNPLNGNMYKPLYFDGGQAIHGANNVPTSPASKGCVRLHIGDQDRLLNWLGLGATSSVVWERSRIGVVVTVIGAY